MNKKTAKAEIIVNKSTWHAADHGGEPPVPDAE
jgi:hypothetical protein